MHTLSPASPIKVFVLAKFGAVLLLLASSATLASAQMLTGGDPSGGLTLNPANVIDAIYTPVDGSSTLQTSDTTVFQGVTFTATNPNITLPSGGMQIYLPPNGGDTAANAGFTNASSPTTEDDNLLNLVNAGLNFSGNPAPNQPAPTMTLTVNNLIGGDSYRIDSIISLLGYPASRDVTIAYNGTPTDVLTLGSSNSFNIYDEQNTVVAASDGTIQVTYSGNDGGFYSGFVVSAIPEPSTWALMFAGIGFLGFYLRRKSDTFRP